MANEENTKPVAANKNAGGSEQKVSADKPPEKPKSWTASIHLAHVDALPDDFVAAIRSLEAKFKLSIVLFVQQGGAIDFDTIDPSVVEAMGTFVRQLPRNKPIGLLIHSPGGYAREAFVVARFFQRHCGGFTAIIPKFAKSAATLLALGANVILMHPDAELGPIDAQVLDPERERRASALDEVQSLSRLHAEALNLIDSTMVLLLGRSRKRTDVILPLVLNYVAQTMRPLFEKIDTVHFTAMSRTLKVGEAYAIRLWARKYPDLAKTIAENLVYDYPDHSFVIDYDEAKRIGLNVELLNPDACGIVEPIFPHMDEITALGSIIESVGPHAL